MKWNSLLICAHLNIFKNQAASLLVVKREELDTTGSFLILLEKLGMIKTDVKIIIILDKVPCQVIDCAFHPDTFMFAYSNSAFQAMIISVAL